MSDQSDSQNMSEQQVVMSEGTSPSSSSDEGSMSTPSNLPKAAKRTRKNKGSDTEDEDFQPKEVTLKKNKVLAKERLVVRKVPISKCEKTSAPKETMTFTLEEPSDT